MPILGNSIAFPLVVFLPTWMKVRHIVHLRACPRNALVCDLRVRPEILALSFLQMCNRICAFSKKQKEPSRSFHTSLFVRGFWLAS